MCPLSKLSCPEQVQDTRAQFNRFRCSLSRLRRWPAAVPAANNAALVLEQWSGKRLRRPFGFWFRRCRIHCIVIEIEKILFVEFNRSRILADIICIVNAPGQAFEIARFDGLELPGAQLGRRSDLIKADAFADSPRPDPQDSCLVHSRTVLVEPKWYSKYRLTVFKGTRPAFSYIWYTPDGMFLSFRQAFFVKWRFHG
jgi:hypothetical protein